MHLRRALLLFAIVLGLAAIAASITRTPSEEATDGDANRVPPPSPTQTTPTAAPAPDVGEGEVVFPADAKKPPRRKVEVGEATTVIVETDEAGLVEIPGLGLTEAAEPDTPARFDVLEDEPLTYEVLFTPAASDESRRVGLLDIT